MKNCPIKPAALIAVCLLATFTTTAPAAIFQVVTNGNGSTAFDGSIAVNLLRNGQSSLASVSASHIPSLSPTFTTAGLNDGSAAGNGNLTYYGATDGTMPVTVTFTLNTNNGTGGSTNGYDLNTIQAISGWTDSNLANQRFQLLLSLNGGPFNNYGTFGAATTINGGANAILNTLTSSSGPIARGVTAIQFVFSNPGGTQAGSGGTVIHELQAFGTPTTTNSQPAPYRIMAVGDSITAGFTDNPNWTVPFQFGYRGGLMTRLVTNGMSFQFVGNSPEPWNGTSGTVPNIPFADLRIAGQDYHEGYGGRSSAFVLGNMSAWLTVDQPDIMLLMIGINDIGQGSTGEPTGTEQNLSNIVATVVSQSPNTRIIVAQITPYASYTDAITKYNNYIANSLVPYFVGQGKFVTTVNQYTNLCTPGTTNIDSSLFANGINHPNLVAYDRMAQTWFNGIKALSLPPAQPSSINANLVINGGFEVPIYTSASHNVNPMGSGWTYTAGVTGAGSGIDKGLAYGAGGANSYDGAQQRACIQSSGNSSVTHLSQAVSGFVVGQYYQLSFWTEAVGAFSGANPFHVSIINGTTTNALFGGTNIVPPTTAYVLYTSAPFQASNTVMTLDFADAGLNDSTHVSWVDGVAINAVTNNNLLINGSFEVPVYGNNTHNVNPTGVPGWLFTLGASGAGSGIDRGDPYSNSGSVEFDGAQQSVLQSSGNSTVTSLSQTVSNLTVGQYYQLSFAAKAITGFSGANPFRVKTIFGTTTNVLFGGSDVFPSAAGYTYYTSQPFQASNSVMTLSFFDRGLSAVTFVSWIDDVSLYAVPPPTIVSTPQAASGVSGSDGALAVNLIRNGQNSLTSVSASHVPTSSPTFTTAGLNDGSTAGNANYAYYANTDATGNGMPVTLTFNLNTNSLTGSPHGYIINSVQAISGWSDSYLANQKFQLLFSLNGGAFTNYGTYSSFNYLNGGNNSLLQTVSGNGAPLATNVTAVQFLFQNPGNVQGGSGGTLIRELQVFGSPVDAIVPTPYLVTDTLPTTATNVVGDQVVFTAAFSNAPAATYQWQKISGGVTNDITDATNATLTLNNLQTTDTAFYRLKAINATNSTGVTFSAARPLTVSSVPAAVNNVVTSLAAQTGIGSGTTFTPTWTVTTNNSLIAGMLSSSSSGNFSLEVPGRSVNSLTAGDNGALKIIAGTIGSTSSTNYVTCGNGGGAGSTITYTLSTSNHGYNLTNLTVYGGWADNGRDQQAYTVYYSTIAAPSTFISLGSVNYNPNALGGLQSATRARLTPAVGALATNVAAVMFDFTTPASENGFCGYSQITLFGSLFNRAPVTQSFSINSIVEQTIIIPVLNGPNAPTDADGDAMSIIAVGTAANGTASTDGTNITYTPVGGFIGTDNFTYTVSDALGATSTATVTVVVYPWAVNPASYSFGLIATGTVAQTTFTITNAGGSTVAGSASASTAAYSVISGSPFSVVAGGTATVTVQFTPTTSTNYNDVLQFTSGSQVINVPVTGVGMAPPVADFVGTPRVGIAPLPVTFTDTSYGSPTNWSWDFGDGVTTNTTSATVQHTYTKTGQWTVALVASNPLGASTNTKAAYISTTPVVRILPVGDSITYGQPVPGGYRTLLAALMTNLNYNVTFTGLLNVNNPVGVTAFHEGHAGANLAGVDYCMQGVFDSTDDPDIILLLLGTNDYGQGIGTGATNRLDAMITHMATNRPNAKIIVANLLLRTDNATLDSQITTTFNPFIPGIVAAHAALGQQVYFADLRSVVTSADLADGLHPNAIGYAKMATNWLTAITNVMGIYGSTNAPAISHVVSQGGLTNVAVTFSKPVADSAANPANFTLSGGATITAATLDAATKRVVTLTTTPLMQNANYTLTVSNVMDLTDAQTPIAGGAAATFKASGARGAANNVAEASHFQLAYSLDIPNQPNYSNGVSYTVDNHNSLGAFGRVAYYLELQSTNGGALQYMWVSMNPFTTNTAKLGVPTVASGAVFQQNVTNMNVASSVPGIATGTNLSGGNLEFWPGNYLTANSSAVANANGSIYDWGDQNTAGNYGSMQIANHDASQMLLSFNAWDGTTVAAADVGIGNNTVYSTGNAAAIDAFTDIQLDWTFRANAGGYAVKTLQVFVQPVPVPGVTNIVAILGSPTTLAASDLAALAGNPANYPLTVTAVSATSTNGSTVNLSSGTITYTPNATGTDKFTYTLSDGHGGTAIGAVTVSVKANTTIGLGSSANSSTYGVNVTFTATVQTNVIAAGNATGSVVFQVDGMAVATNALVGGISSYVYNIPPAGTYVITASYGGDGNYNPSSPTGLTQTVNPAPLGITANADSKTYDELPYSSGNGVTYSGFVNSETPAVLGGSLSYGGDAQGAVNAGSYTIVPSGLNAVNYAISYTNGTLTINPAGTSVGISSSANPSGYRDSLTFTATLPADATGDVIFTSAAGAFSTNSLASGSASSLSITNLPRGTNQITATYLGDGNHLGSINTLDQVVTNHPPVAGDVTYYRANGNSLTLLISDLLTNVTDVDGDSLTLTGVGTGTNSASITSDATYIYYVPVTGANSNRNDHFTYMVDDGYGGSTTANINVGVYNTGVAQLSQPVNGTVSITFYGIPNETYIVQTGTNLITPWWTVSTNVAGPDGTWLFTDPNATNTQQYYRAALP